MDGVSDSIWLKYAVLVALMVLALHVVLPLVTGLACGWLMKGLNIRRGLKLGGVVAAVAVLVNIIGIGFPWSVVNTCIELVLPVAATWLLCRWRAKQSTEKAQRVKG